MRRALLAIAVLTVLFGLLLGMHQLATTAASSHAGVGVGVVIAAERGHQSGLPEPTEPQPGQDHNSTLLHLCLAVLAAIGMLLASRLLLAVVAPDAAIWAFRRSSRAHRPP